MVMEGGLFESLVVGIRRKWRGCLWINGSNYCFLGGVADLDLLGGKYFPGLDAISDGLVGDRKKENIYIFVRI